MSVLNKIDNFAADVGIHINPVGTILTFAGQTIPSGYLLCDGSAVSRTEYAKLYSIIGDTYGEGDGASTFNLPNLIDRFVEGSNTAGKEIDAGLPNITGEVDPVNNTSAMAGGEWYNQSNKGALKAICYINNKAFSETNYTGGSTLDKIIFDASLSNPIYGNSTTVQPPALTMKMIIKY